MMNNVINQKAFEKQMPFCFINYKGRRLEGGDKT